MKRRRVPYSAEELRFVYRNRRKERVAIHAAFVLRFHRTDVTLNHIRGLCTRKGWITQPRWTVADIARLRRIYPNLRTKTVAQRLGRGIYGIYQMAQKLGLEKSPRMQALERREFIARGQKHGKAFRFHKGQEPPNKGKKMPKGWAPGRMAETQFKKGNATNWSPIGTEKIHVSHPGQPAESKYWYRKVADVRNVPWTKNWKALHILRWEAATGQTVNGRTHALKCLDGNSLNTDPANWLLISRAELLLLNRLYRGGRFDAAPAEVKPAMLGVVKLRLETRAAEKRQERRIA